MKYFINRIANITGYSKKDIKIVMDCLVDTLENCVIDVYEDPELRYTFGPFEIYCKKVNRKTPWINPKSGEVMVIVPYLSPSVKIRERFKDVFTTMRRKEREEKGLDFDGTPKY